MTTYLAVYAGPNGPISWTLDALGVDDAHRIAEGPAGRQAYDDAEDFLDVGDGSGILDEAKLAEALDGWTEVYAARTTAEYSLYLLDPDGRVRRFRRMIEHGEQTRDSERKE